MSTAESVRRFGVASEPAVAGLNAVLSGADDRLCAQPLSDAQVGTLLIEPADSDVRDPDQHVVTVRKRLWDGVQEYREVAATHGLTERVSRADVFAVADSAAESGDWVQLLTACYAWGAGRTNVGPARLQRVLAVGNSALNESLTVAVDVLQSQGAVAAYSAMSGSSLPDLDVPDARIAGLGPAFLTKFLYFAGRHRDVAGEQPLILNRRVAAALRQRTAAVLRPLPNIQPDGIAARAWPVGGWSSHRYRAYLRYAGAATDHLRRVANSWPQRTDPIELALCRWADQAPDQQETSSRTQPDRVRL